MRGLLTSFRLRDDGSATVQALFWTVGTIMMLGLAVDGANGRRVQTQLQVASDAAALAAASKISTPDEARTLAVQVAALNLGPSNQAIRAEDIVFGKWDAVQGTFKATNDAPDAVFVAANRKASRQNALSTYMLKFVGIGALDVAAGSIARTVTTTPEPTCTAATIVSSGSLNGGGNNTYNGKVCIHGVTGVQMGGNDWFSSEAKVSAASLSTIQIPHVRAGSAPAASVKVARTLAPRIVPKLPQMWNDRWALYSQTATTYSGNLFPSFLKDPATGSMKIVRKNSHWTIQKGDLQPYTLYLINGGAQFAGNVDARNVAFVVNGHFGVGGGQNLLFEDIYVLGTQVNLAGNVTWGSEATVCGKQRYSAYLFATQSLSMGGWGGQTSIWGVVGAAPSFNPGGSMTATGVYFETSASSTSLGGNMTLTPCASGKGLASEVELATPPSEAKAAGAALVR